VFVGLLVGLLVASVAAITPELHRQANVGSVDETAKPPKKKKDLVPDNADIQDRRHQDAKPPTPLMRSVHVDSVGTVAGEAASKQKQTAASPQKILSPKAQELQKAREARQRRDDRREKAREDADGSRAEGSRDRTDAGESGSAFAGNGSTPTTAPGGNESAPIPWIDDANVTGTAGGPYSDCVDATGFMECAEHEIACFCVNGALNGGDQHVNVCCDTIGKFATNGTQLNTTCKVSCT